jgi:PPP family 3-phenylpropionic acid transporter
MLADRAPRKRTAVLGFAVAALVSFLAHLPATSPWAIIGLAALAGGAYTGLIPIIDAFAMGESRRKRFAFGPPRAWGSATFILGNIACGALIGALGGEAALVWTLSGAGLAVLTAALLPEGRRRAPRSPTQTPGPGGLVAALTANGLPLALPLRR